MPPVTRNKGKLVEAKKGVEAEKYAKRASCNSRKELLLDISQGMLEAYKKNGNRLPYGHVEVLLKQLVKKEPWITRNVINKAFMKHKRESLSRNGTVTTTHKSDTCTNNVSSTTKIPVGNDIIKQVPSSISIAYDSGDTTTGVSDLTGESTRWKSKVGRPSGSTDDRKFYEKRKIIEVKNECARQFANLKEKAKETNGKRVSPSALKEIIKKVSKENHLHGVCITPSAIRRRFYRKRIENHHMAGGHESPLAGIEPIIVEIILQMARIRQCLTPSRAL